MRKYQRNRRKSSHLPTGHRSRKHRGTLADKHRHRRSILIISLQHVVTVGETIGDVNTSLEVVLLESRVNSELPELSYRSCELYSTLEERVATESTTGVTTFGSLVPYLGQGHTKPNNGNV